MTTGLKALQEVFPNAFDGESNEPSRESLLKRKSRLLTNLIRISHKISPSMAANTVEALSWVIKDRNKQLTLIKSKL